MNIHENYELVGACQMPEYSKRMPLRIYDDMFGGLFLAGHEFGPEIVIRAGSFQDAWEIWVDETKSIDPDDVNDVLDLVEVQANSTGTGIVNMGHYAWMKPLTKEIAERHGIVIQISEI